MMESQFTKWNHRIHKSMTSCKVSVFKLICVVMPKEYVRTLEMSHTSVYFGNAGMDSKTPFINCFTKRSSPNVGLSDANITADNADLAALIALYPNPCLNHSVRNSIPSQ